MDADRAPYLLAEGAGDARSYGGNLFTFKADARQTGGSFSLAEIVMRKGTTTPLHVHRRETEAFYVLDGEMAFEVGGERWTAGPGSFVMLPTDVPHAFGPAGEEARVLAVWAPGGLEEMFREFGAVATSRDDPSPEVDLEALGRRMEELGVEVVGPPFA